MELQNIFAANSSQNVFSSSVAELPPPAAANKNVLSNPLTSSSSCHAPGAGSAPSVSTSTSSNAYFSNVTTVQAGSSGSAEAAAVQDDAAANNKNMVLEVNCRNFVGRLHVDHFISGIKGKSIVVGATWHTPREFEVAAGCGRRQDWKRSIRCGDSTLLTLIERRVLKPHAVACRCQACRPTGGDETEPVRPFVKKRTKASKRQAVGGPSIEQPLRPSIPLQQGEQQTRSDDEIAMLRNQLAVERAARISAQNQVQQLLQQNQQLLDIINKLSFL